MKAPKFQDRTGEFSQIDFEITHACQKQCKYCDHRVWESEYSMTPADLAHVIDCVRTPETIKAVLIAGGEPLMHPGLFEIINPILDAFPSGDLRILTNGKLLPHHGLQPFDRDVNWTISEYPGWNDDVVARYQGEPRVTIYRFGGGFWDTFKDPMLHETLAKKARALCMLCVRVLGTRLYGCCLSEPIERTLNFREPVHVQFSETWKEDVVDLPTWRACAHCFRAAHLLEQGTMFPRREVKH